MSKYIDCTTNKEVKLGETISAEFIEENCLGKKKVSFEFLVNKETLPTLLKEGILKEVKEDKKEVIEVYYIKLLAEGWNKSFEDTIESLQSLWNLYPFAVCSILYRIVCVDMCKAKNLSLNQIIKQDSFYMITFAPKTDVIEVHAGLGLYTKTNNGAFFSTKEEAENAITIVSKLVTYLKHYHRNNEQKN